WRGLLRDHEEPPPPRALAQARAAGVDGERHGEDQRPDDRRHPPEVARLSQKRPAPHALANSESSPWCRSASRQLVVISSRPCERQPTVRPSRFVRTNRLWNTMRMGASRLESNISRSTPSDSFTTPPQARALRRLKTITSTLSIL